jgi:hypothetical protein
MKIIEIFEGDSFQAQMVKNLLEIEGVESFLRNESSMMIFSISSQNTRKILSW